MKVEEKVVLNALKHSAESHITLEKKACDACAGKPCLRACPAGLYAIEPETGEVTVDHSGCLECGTCMVVCPTCGVAWRYPDPGFGIRYRHG